MRKIQHKYIWIVAGLIVASILLSFAFRDAFDFLKSRESLEIFLTQFGEFAPLAVISIIIVEVIIAPLPGGAMPVVAGFLFGPFLGTLYSWLGNVIGSIIAFWIARIWGERAIKFFAPKFKKNHYDNAIQHHSIKFWILYSFPIAPVDILSFALGTSSMKFDRFLAFISIAFLLRVAILSFAGDILSKFLFL
jgi:uncharacterized membrane protein YdjX (TVP38/TMEM64 family)